MLFSLLLSKNTQYTVHALVMVILKAVVYHIQIKQTIFGKSGRSILSLPSYWKTQNSQDSHTRQTPVLVFYITHCNIVKYEEWKYGTFKVKKLPELSS